MEKMLYHVTRKENLPKIMTEGLVPMKGENSRTCGEEDNVVYLTDEKSLPYWYILTDADTVVSIDRSIVTELEEAGRIEKLDYSRYEEYRVKCTIPVRCLKTVSAPGEAQLLKTMKILDVSYTYVISDVCCELLKADIRKPDDNRMKDIAARVESVKAITDRIHFWTNNPWKYRGLIMDYSNYACAITFSDYYYPGASTDKVKDAGKRCFEHLVNLESEILRPAGIVLYELITRIYAKCVLYPEEIGGFCI